MIDRFLLSSRPFGHHLFKFIFSFCLFAFSLFGRSQTPGKDSHFHTIALGAQWGKIIPTTDFVKGENARNQAIRHFRSASLKWLCQNSGESTWNQAFRMPYYGFGLSMGDFFRPEELGRPVSVYGVLGVPVLRMSGLELFSEFQYGIASNWSPYDSLSNPHNLAIGGPLTVHLDLGFHLLIPLNQSMDFTAGCSFIHFSNGGFERPNRGLNLYAPSAGIKYHLRARPTWNNHLRKQITDTSDRLSGWKVFLGYGNYQLVEHELDSNYFAVGGISALYFRRLGPVFRLGAGVDFNYWMGLTALPDGRMGRRDWRNLSSGFVLQPEFQIQRFSLVGGMGLYLNHYGYGDFRQSYQRLGVRYDLTRGFSAGVNVRAIRFMLAEFMEFNLCYHLGRRK